MGIYCLDLLRIIGSCYINTFLQTSPCNKPGSVDFRALVQTALGNPQYLRKAAEAAKMSLVLWQILSLYICGYYFCKSEMTVNKCMKSCIYTYMYIFITHNCIYNIITLRQYHQAKQDVKVWKTHTLKEMGTSLGSSSLPPIKVKGFSFNECRHR